MVKHVILWKLKDEYTDAEKAEIKAGIKENLEGLVGVVPGLRSLKIITEYLPCSNAEVMLDSELDSYEALKGYADHPAHVHVADTFVRPFVAIRLAMDYEV